MQWVIGDIHGCCFTLQRLLEKVRDYDDEAQFVFVGDYVDRGLWSSKVVELVIEEQKQGACCLRGNHDDVIDWIINGRSVGNLREMVCGPLELITVGVWWLNNGLAPTLISYGVQLFSGLNLESALRKFVDNVPDDHKKFFRELKLYWENDTHFACHAYLNPTQPLPRKLAMLPDSEIMNTLWSRFPVNYIETGTYGSASPAGVGGHLPVWNKIGVFGHSPVGVYGGVAPLKHGKIRLIDTSAFSGEYLTAYCCERDSWILQATDTRDIESKKGD